MDSPFQTSARVIENYNVLHENYQPDEIIERDEEINEYANALRPAIEGWTPNNIFVYGKTGVGKTAVTNYMMDALRHELDQKEDADPLTTVFINCQSCPTSYQAMIEITNRLRDGHEEITKGHSRSHITKAMFEEIEARGGTVLVILDEIDHLEDDDHLLYELPRAHSNNRLNDTRVAMIGISNDYTYRENLSPKVKSTLMEREIRFSPYTADELQTILRARAETALVDMDCLNGGVVPLCSALATQDEGSARQAIDLLREACSYAEEEGDTTVTEDHVRTAEQRVERGKIESAIPDLTMHGRLTLLSVAHAERSEETPIRSKDLYSIYERHSRENGTDPLSERSVRDHLDDLAMLGFIDRTEVNKGRKGGKYHEYELDIPVQSVYDTLGEMERL